MQDRFDMQMTLMQDELEKRSNQEKAELLDQLQQLRRDYSASFSSVDENSESIKELEPYSRMQSIAHTPPSTTPMSSTPDLSKRIVIGEERATEVHSPNQLTTPQNLSEQDDDIQTGYIDISCVEGNLEMSYLNESLQKIHQLTEEPGNPEISIRSDLLNHPTEEVDGKRLTE